MSAAFVCTGCSETKDADAFYVRASGLRRRRCQGCMAAANAANYAANRERATARGALRHQRVREQRNAESRAAYQADRATKLAKNREWRQANKGRTNSYSVAYKARKNEQLPTWANLDEIAAAYVFAQAWSRVTGVPHHVDHIVPLRGRGASGLHCEDNLQIIPAVENLSKQDRYWSHEVARPQAFQ